MKICISFFWWILNYYLILSNKINKTMNLKKLYMNDGPEPEVKPQDKPFAQMDTQTFEQLSQLDKRTFYLQEKFYSLMPWLMFVTVVQGIGIILGFLYLLLNLK